MELKDKTSQVNSEDNAKAQCEELCKPVEPSGDK